MVAVSDLLPLHRNPACNPVCRVCHYKTLEYPEQLARMDQWAGKQLVRWSGVLQPIRPAPDGERLAYRSKSWLRCLVTDSDGGADISFGMLKSVWEAGEWRKELVSWNTCPIHVVPLQRMIASIRELLMTSGLELSRRSLAGLWVGSPQVVIVSRGDDYEEWRRLDWSRSLVAPFDRLWFHSNPNVGIKVFGHRPILPILPESAEVESSHPIKAFRQVAQTLLSEARTLAVRSLVESGPEMIVDLYCGTADIAAMLPETMGWLGVEMSKDAVQHANAMNRPGAPIHRAFVGAIEHRLADARVQGLVDRSYALYVNPPRSGLSDEARDQVTRLIGRRAPTAIAYLSCSASSLGRDLVAFETAGYRVDRLQPYDFFPQTEHFETLALLSPCPR